MNRLQETALNVTRTENVILIPPTLYKHSDVCGDTKIIIGSAITECVRKMYETNDPQRYAASAVRHVRAYALDHDVSSIALDCSCSLEQAQNIKAELIKLTETLDIKKCFFETGIEIHDNYTNIGG